MLFNETGIVCKIAIYSFRAGAWVALVSHETVGKTPTNILFCTSNVASIVPNIRKAHAIGQQTVAGHEAVRIGFKRVTKR